jgi:hypothetical protein
MVNEKCSQRNGYFLPQRFKSRMGSFPAQNRIEELQGSAIRNDAFLQRRFRKTRRKNIGQPRTEYINDNLMEAELPNSTYYDDDPDLQLQSDRL